MLEVTMLKKYGPENLATHYAEFDTICDATQVSLFYVFTCCRTHYIIPFELFFSRFVIYNYFFIRYFFFHPVSFFFIRLLISF